MRPDTDGSRQLEHFGQSVSRVLRGLREFVVELLLRTSGEPRMVVSQREYDELRLTADVLADKEAMDDLAISEREYEAGEVVAWDDYRKALGLGGAERSHAS
jgi:PHD/YefM family antitoxin component YafN of YafNO toxin-antitoxin module